MNPSIATQLDRIANLGIRVHHPGLRSNLKPTEAEEIANTLVTATSQYPILLHSAVRPLKDLYFATSDLDDSDASLAEMAYETAAVTSAVWTDPSYIRLFVNDRHGRLTAINAEPGLLSPASLSTTGVIWHELGHVLGFAANVQQPPTIYDQIIGFDINSEIYLRFLEKYSITRDDAASVSRYAWDSPVEALAEFFAMWNVPGFRETLSPVLGSKVERLINDLANGVV